MTAVHVLLAGAAITIVGSLLALTIVAYVGRWLMRERVRPLKLPAARVVKR
ncbi:MAG: hypothetical protein AB7T06_34275 [Kofleriaceae bacterium]